MATVARPFTVYPDPESSETAGEYTTLQDALLARPTTGAEIVQNGTVMATVRLHGWNLTPAGRRAL